MAKDDRMTSLARRFRQQIFIRVCRDSGFRVDAINAAYLAAMIARCHPLHIWLAMPDMDTMERIAAGKHPAAQC